MRLARDLLWKTVGKTLFAFTPHSAYAYRTRLLKLFGMKCGLHVRARRSVRIDRPWNVSADDLVMFGDGGIVQAEDKIKIGKRCVVSQSTMLITTAGDVSTAGQSQRCGPITIEDDCWVATDALVMPSSHIEHGVVVGARGLVDGHLPKWTICTGEPATPRTRRVLYEQN